MIQEMINTLVVAQKDSADFFDKGNKAAGVRLRKKMQHVKNLASTVRLLVTDENKVK